MRLLSSGNNNDEDNFTVLDDDTLAGEAAAPGGGNDLCINSAQFYKLLSVITEVRPVYCDIIRIPYVYHTYLTNPN